MEEYLTEREQVEELRGVIKENAPWAVGGLLIGAALIVGYQQYGVWQVRQSLTASQKYSAALASLSRADKDSAKKVVAELRADYARTPYADLAALALTRFEVSTNDLADAARVLEEVMKTSRDPEMQVVARLRLARVQRAQDKPDLALATLAGVPSGSSTPAFAEVRGDALADKGDKAGALSAWREALEAKMPGMINRELIGLKISALGSVPATLPATPAATPAASSAAPAAAPAATTTPKAAQP